MNLLTWVSRAPWRWAGLLIASTLLNACGLPLGGYGVQGQLPLDSVTAAYRQAPVLCAPSAAPVPLKTAAVAIASTTVVATAATLRTLDKALEQTLTQAIEECANTARRTVLIQRNFTRPPTPEQCRAQALDSHGRLLWDSQGNPITLARQLGKEMHDVAFDCVRARLSATVPGRFLLEPRYRYDRSTNKTTFIPPEEEQALLRAGGEQLKGTLKPDVVIHNGNPVEALRVYDFKFPCVDSDDTHWPKKKGKPCHKVISTKKPCTPMSSGFFPG